MSSIFDTELNDGVFDNRDVLTDDYQPETIVGREDERQEYLQALKPVYTGAKPKTVFCHGPNGVGKSATTKYMIRELKKSDNLSRELTAIEVDCESVNTQYQLARRAANKLLPLEEKIRGGIPNDVTYDYLFDAIDRTGGTVLIVADEMATVKDAHRFIYQVCRARKKGKLTEAKVGIIALTTDPTFAESLKADAESSLRPSTIEFSTYDAPDLREVLEQRVPKAFVSEDTLEDDVVPLCSAIVGQESGDARKALNLLERSGELAEEAGKSKIGEGHVREAHDRVERSNVFESVKKLHENARLTAYAIVSLEAEGSEAPKTSDVHERYKIFAKQVGKDPVGSRQLLDYCSKLDELGFVSSKSVGGSGGYRKKHALEFPPNEAAVALEKTIESTGVHPSIESANVTTAD